MCASGQATTYTMTPPNTATMVSVKDTTGEWSGALLSSVMRVGSICMRVMDIQVYSIDMVSVIFPTAFAHYTQAPSSECVRP